MMDYRKILKAYVRHIIRMEGTDFLSSSVEGLTAEELAELNAMGDEAYEAHNVNTAKTMARMQSALEKMR